MAKIVFEIAVTSEAERDELRETAKNYLFPLHEEDGLTTILDC